MARREIDAFWDRKTRNDLNENFRELYDKDDNLQKQINDLVIESNGDSNAEVVQARGGHRVLADRLNEMEGRISRSATREELYRETNAKADKSYVNQEVQKVNDRISEIITDPADGISEQEIIDAREGKRSLGENIRDVREKTEVNIVNKVKNGDFSTDGLFDFFVTFGSAENRNGVAVVTGNSGMTGGVLNQKMDEEIPQNQIWYFKTRVRAMEEGAHWLAVGARGTQGSNTGRVNNPVAGRWYTITHYIDDFSGLYGNFNASVYSYWPDASGKTIEIDNMMAINLTEAFGRGNEPSKEFMDDFVELHPYFDGDAGAGRTYNFILDKNKEIAGSVEGLETFAKSELKEVKKSELEDIITNGNFEENRDGWVSQAGTWAEHLPGWLRLVGIGEERDIKTVQTINTDYDVGDVLYISADFRPQNNVVSQLGFAIYSNDSSEEGISYLTRTGFDPSEIIRVSGNVAVSSAQGDMRVQVRVRYPSAEDSDDQAVDVTNIKLFNLTKFFGEGNEPNAEAFERMLSVMTDKADNRTTLPQTQKALTQHIIERMNIMSSQPSRKPLCVIEFDDGNLTDYTMAYPFLRARGIKATVNVTIDLLGRQNYMNWEHLHELKNAGWGVEGHTYSNSTLVDLTDEEIRQEMIMSNEAFLENGLGKPRHEALVGGVAWDNERVKDIVSEYRKTIRNSRGYVTRSYNTYDGIDFKNLIGLPIDVREDRADRTPIIKEIIADAAQNNGIIIPYAHRFVESNAGPGEGYFEPWSDIIEFIIDQDFEFVTRDELYLRLKQ